MVEIKYLNILNKYNKHTHRLIAMFPQVIYSQEKWLHLIMKLVLEITDTQVHQNWNYTHLRKVSWSGVSLQKGRGRKHYFSLTRLWESQVNKDQKALRKGPLKIGTGYKARVFEQLNFWWKFFSLFCFVIEVKEFKQNGSTLPEA